MQKLKVTANYSMLIPEFVKVFGGDYRGNCNTEDSDLISCVAYLKAKYPMYANLIAHIPNESMMPVQGRVKAKQKGLLREAPDLIIMTTPTIAIELKRRDPTKSLASKKAREHAEGQVEILNRIGEEGGYACLAFGYEGFIECFNEVIKPALDDKLIMAGKKIK